MESVFALLSLGGFIFTWFKLAKKLANKAWIVRHAAGAFAGLVVMAIIINVGESAGLIEGPKAYSQKTVKQSEPVKNVELQPESPQKTDQNIVITASDIISVSDYELSVSDKQAVSIAFGESENNYCSVTINRESVYEGYTVQSVRNNNNKVISFECNWDSALFILNDNIDTNVKLELISLDNQNKTAVLMISAKLHELTKLSENRFGSIAKLMGVKLTITGNNFDNLIKQM